MEAYVFLDCHKPHAEDKAIESDYAIEDGVVRYFIQEPKELARREWFWPYVVSMQRTRRVREPSLLAECNWVALES